MIGLVILIFYTQSRTFGSPVLFFYQKNPVSKPDFSLFVKEAAARYDMLPPSRTLKYKTYLGVFLCLDIIKLIQHLKLN